MRILYGINSQGQGHLSKAAVLVPLLEARGHEVRLISSGPPPSSGYRFTWHRHFHGLEYVIADGRTNYGRTARNWLRDLPKLTASLRRVRRLIREFEPELILSDFEPLTASPLIDPRCEVVAVSRQVALFDRAIPLPDGMGLEKKLARTMIRLFTCGADRRYGYHYEPASFRCLPPVLRPELHHIRPTEGEHVFVYNFVGPAEPLIEWANSRRQPVRAYGFPQMPRGRQGYVEFRAPGRQQLLEDLASCRAVITTAGLSTPLEAFVLHKPTIVVPIPNQWEQLVNAFHLQNAGLAEWLDDWHYDRLLELPPVDPYHRLRAWMSTHADRILDHILDEQRPLTAQQPRITAA